MTDTPKPEPVYVCTLSPNDKGDACTHCGHASGYGHGKARG